MNINSEQHKMLDHISVIVQQMTELDDLAHGWDHIKRVYRQAISIAEKEYADIFIVALAALLHDLGHTQSENGKRHHADVSVTLATEILQTYRLDESTEKAILHAIVAHSFSRGVVPQSLEASVVRDADRLDALGALGIARWAIVGSQRSSQGTKLYHQNDPFGVHRKLDDHLYMLDHFSTKLLTLPETMLTETGRQLAQERAQFMQAYIDEFRKELTAF